MRPNFLTNNYQQLKPSILSLSYSLLFCLAVIGAQAQIGDPQQPAVEDTTTRERPKRPDSLKEKFYLRNIRFGTDLITVGKNQFNKTFSGWEGNVELDCGYYYFA